MLRLLQVRSLETHLAWYLCFKLKFLVEIFILLQKKLLFNPRLVLNQELPFKGKGT